MKIRPHTVFVRSQSTLTLDVPNDVLFDLMSLSKRLNLLIRSKLKNGYRITEDELNTMALEDFNERYMENVEALYKRINGK